MRHVALRTRLRSNEYIDDSGPGTRYYKPPEVAKTVFSRKPEPYDGHAFDLWSMGVILFLLSYKDFPFKNNSEKSDPVIKAMMKAQEKRESTTSAIYRYWNRPCLLEPALCALIDGLLVIDPRGRFTIEQVVQHEWLAESSTPVPRQRGGGGGSVPGSSGARGGGDDRGTGGIAASVVAAPAAAAAAPAAAASAPTAAVAAGDLLKEVLPGGLLSVLMIGRKERNVEEDSAVEACELVYRGASLEDESEDESEDSALAWRAAVGVEDRPQRTQRGGGLEDDEDDVPPPLRRLPCER